MKVSKQGFKMNRVAYRNLGTLLKYEKRKKGRSYQFTFFTRANGFKGSVHVF